MESIILALVTAAIAAIALRPQEPQLVPIPVKKKATEQDT